MLFKLELDTVQCVWLGRVLMRWIMPEETEFNQDSPCMIANISGTAAQHQSLPTSFQARFKRSTTVPTVRTSPPNLQGDETSCKHCFKQIDIEAKI